ncbi:MAG: thymidine phosphorylase [Spirochaetes bacterium]|nr:thymidine phosphorylase [Spirochaetota bacterium]
MRVYDIILKKRNGLELQKEEISFMVKGYTEGKIPDYQMAAFLMAVWYQKMKPQERSYLTLEMLNSGDKFDLSDIPGIKVDKHSTGGVGDGPSLALTPIVAAAGGVVPMMSGRGLGHTGGTLDKLESIPGYQVVLSREELELGLKKARCVIMGQSENVAPADKKMYSLRDVTATVDSIDLISASIMSKKLAEGMDALVLDVKTGKGAFMQKLEDSIALARSMVEIGVNLGKTMFSYITDMNQPLGRNIGNALEMIQAIETLKGKGPRDYNELVLTYSARMLVMAKVVKNVNEGKIKAKEMISSGKALEYLEKMIRVHKGDPSVIEDYSKFPGAEIKKDLPSPQKGYISQIDAYTVGISAVLLGAGRETMESRIDYGVGFILNKKAGDKVEKNEPLATIYANDEGKLKTTEEKLIQAFNFEEKRSKIPPLVYGYVTDKGFTKEETPRP